MYCTVSLFIGIIAQCTGAYYSTAYQYNGIIAQCTERDILQYSTLIQYNDLMARCTGHVIAQCTHIYVGRLKQLFRCCPGWEGES